jgi:hypothetical protein
MFPTFCNETINDFVRGGQFSIILLPECVFKIWPHTPFLQGLKLQLNIEDLTMTMK